LTREIRDAEIPREHLAHIGGVLRAKRAIQTVGAANAGDELFGSAVAGDQARRITRDCVKQAEQKRQQKQPGDDHEDDRASMARGHYKHLKFGSLSARIIIQDGMLDLDRVSGQSTNGEVAGRIVVQLPPKQPADAELSVRATGLLVEDMLKFFGPKAGVITGEARVTGTLRGHGKNPHGLYPTLDGKMELLLENGRIFKSPERAVWKIISILNLPAVLQGKVDLEKDGLPYNKISATVIARNGLFETENLIIDSPIVKITAAGNYDLPTDQIDMVWAVSPFGSYAQFLKTIPLFGRLFAGDRKGLATALFSVKGSIGDPEVTYLPMKSFATGVTGLAQLAFDILKNTVMLPIDLMTPDEEKGSVKDTVPTPEPSPSVP
jgi:hypothetical protein